MSTLIVKEEGVSRSPSPLPGFNLPPPICFGADEFAARLQNPDLSKDIVGSTFMVAAKGGVFVTGTCKKGEPRRGELVFTFETAEGKSVEISRSEFRHAALLRGNPEGLGLSDFAFREALIRRTDVPGITERAPAQVSEKEMADRIRRLVGEAARAEPVLNAAWLSEASKRFIGYRLDVSAYAPEVGSINIYRSTVRSVSYGIGLGMQQPVMVMLPARSIAAVFNPVRARSPEFCDALDSVEMGLNGNEIEVDYALPLTEPVPMEHWDRRDNFEMKIYGTRIHPAAISKLKECLPALGSSSIRVVDIFGGNGAFARRLAACTSPLEQVEMHIIDGNQHCIEEAKAQCADGLRAHHADLIRTRLSDIVPGPLDIVTAIGALTRGVIDRAQAFQIASEVFHVLRPGGMFLLTGFTALKLNAEDFSGIGFELLNKSVPANVLELDPGGCQPEQLYVLKKPE